MSKDFNKMLRNAKDMPKIQVVSDRKTIERYGGERMYFAPPMAYDELMRQVPCGSVTTVGTIRAFLAEVGEADFTDPMTAGIFINLAAWASEQRETDKTPYWRTLKANGELNPKYPGGIEAQRLLLEAEGHTVVQKGSRCFVKEYEAALWSFCRSTGDRPTP